MADFKKGSNEFNLPTTAGGQLALRHRKVIVAGLGAGIGARNKYTIYDEDTNSRLVVLDPSDTNEYVTASIKLRTPAIIDCFVESGILDSASQSSIIPEYLNTSHVEVVGENSWSIKFSYGGKNFVIRPVNSGTHEMTCESLSLYRHTINLYLSSHPKYFSIYFDIFNNYSKPYTTLDDVKNALTSICSTNNVNSVTFPCSGYYSELKTDSNTYPYGIPNGFVTRITHYRSTAYLSCVAYSLTKNLDGDYSQNASTETISTASVNDTVQFLS